MNGILVINKPAGFTSFDVIAKLRGILHMKRLGHAGTLDPMATGVLPVFVGHATKACDILPSDEKRYSAEFQLGLVTDTQDSTGTVLETHSVPENLNTEMIRQAVPQGNILQIPPMYSAVKIGGKKLYELAREGREIVRPARPVTVDRVECTAYDPETHVGKLTIHCRKGTYVRTLIHDMGQTLGCGAAMTRLQRDHSSGFDLAVSCTLGQVQQYADAGRAGELLIPTEEAFSCLPRLCLDEKQTNHYRNGVKLGLAQLCTQLTDAECYRIYGEPDGFLGTAVTDREENCLRVQRNLCEPR